MGMKNAIATGMLVLGLAAASAAVAQQTTGPPAATPPATAPTATTPPVSPSNVGVGQPTRSTEQVDKGQNMILPSAGSSGPSAAPTMVYDCQNRPHECTEPATPRDRAGAATTAPIKP